MRIEIGNDSQESFSKIPLLESFGIKLSKEGDGKKIKCYLEIPDGDPKIKVSPKNGSTSSAARSPTTITTITYDNVPIAITHAGERAVAPGHRVYTTDFYVNVDNINALKKRR